MGNGIYVEIFTLEIFPKKFNHRGHGVTRRKKLRMS
jgi:hypothetical protein